MAGGGFNRKAIVWAVQEIYWAYVPLIVLVFVMGILGQIGKLADMPDFLIVVAILFGESASKISKIKTGVEGVWAVFCLGNLAFALSIILWVLCFIFSSLRIPALVDMIDFNFYYTACLVLWMGAFIYSIYVRVLIYNSELEVGLSKS